MGLQESLIGYGAPRRNFFEVEHADTVHLLEIAQDEEQLAEAKALDDLAFGTHLGVSIEDLIEIMNHGAVIMLRNQYGGLIGEAQVITSPISKHPYLMPDEAYDYGTAIHPELQNHGIAQILYKAQELIALKAGKARSTLTVRLENAQSLRGRFKAGYQVTGYNPTRYGSVEDDGARLIMEKDHTRQNDAFASSTLLRKVEEGGVLLVDQDNVERAIQEDHSLLGLVINSGDEIDFGAHNLMSTIFRAKNFSGIGLLKPDEINSNAGQSLLIFKYTDPTAL